jgi:hypothetical protein
VVEGFPEALVIAGQAGAEDLEVDPGTAATNAESEAATREMVQEGGLLREGNRMPVGQHAHRRADRDPVRSAKDVGGEGYGGGADTVGDEVVLGDPCASQAGSLGGEGRLHCSCEGTTLGHAGELAHHQEQPELQLRPPKE